jgi:MFS family permease
MDQAQANKKRIKVCILSASLIQMCFVGLAAAIADIAAYFPEYSVTVIQTGVNTINFMGIFGALLSGWLSYKQPKKTLTLLGLALVAIGGVGGFFLHDTLVLFFAWSLVIGAGMGIFTPPAMSLVIDHFDGNERNKMSGLQTAFINAGGVVLTFVGGLLAAIAWNFSYLALLLAAPVLVICAISMPKKNVVVSGKSEKQKLPGCVAYYVVTALLQMMVYNAFTANIALFLVERHFGNASLAGGVNAVFMIGGVAMGLLFSKLSLRIGEYVFAVSQAMLLVCFVLLILSHSIVLVFIAAFIGGMSISLTIPQCLYSVSFKIPPAASGAVVSLVASVAPSIAVFISPTVMAVLSGLFSDAGDSVSRFVAAGVLGLAFAAMQFVIVTNARKRDALSGN